MLVLAVSIPLAHADTPNPAALVQAETQANLTRAFRSVDAALGRLDEGPVAPVHMKTPKGVSIAAPKAPVKTPAPKIDLASLPPDLRRPVTIRWNGPLIGAVDRIAEQMNYNRTRKSRNID